MPLLHRFHRPNLPGPNTFAGTASDPRPAAAMTTAPVPVPAPELAAWVRTPRESRGRPAWWLRRYGRLRRHQTDQPTKITQSNVAKKHLEWEHRSRSFCKGIAP